MLELKIDPAFMPHGDSRVVLRMDYNDQGVSHIAEFDTGITYRNSAEQNLTIANAYDILKNEDARRELAEILGGDDITYGPNESPTDFQTEFNYLSVLVDGDATNSNEMTQQNGMILGKLDDKLFIETYNDLGASSRKWYNMKTESVDYRLQNFFEDHGAIFSK